MYRLKYHGLVLPPVWVCDKDEADLARSRGVPFLIRPKSWSDERLVKAILYGWLVKNYPYIKWSEIFSVPPKSAVQIEVPAEWRENPGVWTDGWTDDDMQVTENGEYRMTDGGMDPEEDFVDLYEFDDVSFDEFFDPSEITVDISVLQQLRLLPKFMDDIATAIKTNLYNTMWIDGWNKKLNAPMGRYQGSDEAPNLIILDVSGSIPRGIASTMISLIDTLRTQANADLIITSGCSRYWKKGDELPTPDQLSHMVGGCNEARQFYQILNEHILGKHWGNIIVFGDQDAPDDWRFVRQQEGKPASNKLTSTRIDNLMCFHTYARMTPGYGKWVKLCQPKVNETIDITWSNHMKDW